MASQEEEAVQNLDQSCEKKLPEHLVIMVNGIGGCAGNWRFAADQFVKTFPGKVVVHCSERNASISTFDGIDVMGKRLAEEVETVTECNPGLKKISFISHSVGGLVARYAIGRLYEPPVSGQAAVGNVSEMVNDNLVHNGKEQTAGTIAGLEPVNFITVATPHLGSKGNKQVPFLCGVTLFEKVACFGAHWVIGRTGRHLFLTDNDEGEIPLLRRMVNDCGDLYFMSGLRAFKRRIAYANVSYDHIVGWRTASIRRESELPKLQAPLNERYPHIVYVENESGDDAMPEDGEPESQGHPASDPEEEEMIAGLTQVPWQRVDVSFHRSKQRFVAHSTIQVKFYWMHSEGADVILHMIDNFHE